MDTIRFYRRIWFKITGIFLVAILPLVAVIVSLNALIQRDAVEHGRNLVFRAVFEAASAQDRIVADIRQMLSSLAEEEAVRSFDAGAMDALVASLQAKRRFLGNVFVCDRAGNLLASAQKPFQGMNVSHRSYFEEVLRRGDFSAGQFAIGLVAGRQSLHFAMPVRDDAGRIVGVAAASIALDWYGRTLHILDVPAGAFVAFFDRQGVLLTRHPPSPASRPGDPSGVFAPDQTPWRQASGAFVSAGPGGVETIYAYRHMRLGPDDPEAYGLMVVGMPVAVAVAAARERMVASALVSGASAVAAVAMLVIVSRVVIVRRLQILASAAVCLKEERTCRLPDRFGDDEIGLLGKVFSSMSVELREKKERLAEALASLGRERDHLSRVVGQLRAAQAELVRQASLDYLTGLQNRRCFNEAMRREFFRLRRYDQPFSLILFDIDDFKTVNDIHGHGSGDEVLRRMAAGTLEVLREVDTAYRVGGEEFAVILPETRAEQAMVVAERLRERLAGQETVATDGTLLRVTVSLGVAEARPEMEGPDALYGAADGALYLAKRSGKNRSVLSAGQEAA